MAGFHVVAQLLGIMTFIRVVRGRPPEFGGIPDGADVGALVARD